MKEVFPSKSFWFILGMLLAAACLYPPFRLMTEAGITAERKWEFILTTLPTLYEVPEIDLKMLLFEIIMTFPLAIGISLIVLGLNTVLRQRRRSRGKIANPED